MAEGDRELVGHTLELGVGVKALVALCEEHVVVLGLPLAEGVPVALPQEDRVPLPDAVTERVEECEADTVKESSAEGVLRALALTLCELARVLL